MQIYILWKTLKSYPHLPFFPAKVTRKPVTLIQLPVQDNGLRLIVNDCYQVEIDERFSSSALQHLLQILEGR